MQKTITIASKIRVSPNPFFQQKKTTPDNHPFLAKYKRKKDGDVYLPKVVQNYPDYLEVQRGQFNLLKDYINVDEYEIKDYRTEVDESFEFKGSLRPYQELVCQQAIRKEEGVIIIPTGGGKTVLALAMIARLRQRALIIVHLKDLMYQTGDKIKKFLGFTPSYIGDGHFSYDMPITVGLVQSLKTRARSIAGEFGCVIADETDLFSAPTFSQVLSELPARYRFGLTATNRRSDKLEWIFEAILGEKITEITTQDISGFLSFPCIVPIFTKNRLREIDYCYSKCWKSDSCEYFKENEFLPDDRRKFCDKLHEYFWVFGVSKLTESEARNQLIAKTIAETKGEFNLVLADRIKHGVKIKGLLANAGIESEAISSKTDPQYKTKVIEKFKQEGGVLIATTKLLGRGFDMMDIDRLYLLTPTSSGTPTKQRVGRIMRPKDERPVVYDFVDGLTERFKKAWWSRRSTYKKLGFEILAPAKAEEIEEEKADLSGVDLGDYF